MRKSVFNQYVVYKRNKWCGVVANVLDCDIVVCEFEHQSCYWIHFRTNTTGKGMNHPSYPTRCGLHTNSYVLRKEWIKQANKIRETPNFF